MDDGRFADSLCGKVAITIFGLFLVISIIKIYDVDSDKYARTKVAELINGDVSSEEWNIFNKETVLAISRFLNKEKYTLADSGKWEKERQGRVIRKVYFLKNGSQVFAKMIIERSDFSVPVPMTPHIPPKFKLVNIEVMNEGEKGGVI